MTIPNIVDVENGEIVYVLDDLEAPLIKEEHKGDENVGHAKDENDGSEDKDSICTVLFSTAVASCGSFSFGTCAGYSAPTQAAIREDLNLTVAQFSTFGSILTVGAMIGGIAGGRIAELFGRKRAMRLAACISMLGWLAIYSSKGALLLDIGRLLTGCGLGVFSYVVPIFISELAPKNLRGGLATMNQLMIVSGIAVSFIIGTFITWRTMALGGLVPCIFLFVGMFFVPESPRWLAKVGREREFEVALRLLRGENANIYQEATEIQDNIRSIQALPKVKLMDLFKSKYISSVSIGVVVMSLQQFVGINGIGFYSREIFVAAGVSGSVGSIAYASVQVPITVISASVIDRCGRRPLLMLSATGIFLGCSMTGISFLLKTHNLLLNWVPLLAISGVLTYISSFSIGFGAVPWVLMSEIFPTEIKGAGGSLVTLAHWIWAWLISYSFNFLMGWSSSAPFFIYAGFSVLTVLYVGKFVPETKGKTLEEIQACIHSNTLK